MTFNSCLTRTRSEPGATFKTAGRPPAPIRARLDRPQGLLAPVYPRHPAPGGDHRVPGLRAALATYTFPQRCTNKYVNQRTAIGRKRRFRLPPSGGGRARLG